VHKNVHFMFIVFNCTHTVNIRTDGTDQLYQIVVLVIQELREVPIKGMGGKIKR